MRSGAERMIREIYGRRQFLPKLRWTEKRLRTGHACPYRCILGRKRHGERQKYPQQTAKKLIRSGPMLGCGIQIRYLACVSEFLLSGLNSTTYTICRHTMYFN